MKENAAVERALFSNRRKVFPIWLRSFPKQRIKQGILHSDSPTMCYSLPL